MRTIRVFLPLSRKLSQATHPALIEYVRRVSWEEIGEMLARILRQLMMVRRTKVDQVIAWSKKRSSLKTETVASEVKPGQLDRRYEGYRMKNPGLEERLLGSISQRGIEAPLEGMEVGPVRILFNGFKRYRCARKLQLHPGAVCPAGSG